MLEKEKINLEGINKIDEFNPEQLGFMLMDNIYVKDDYILKKQISNNSKFDCTWILKDVDENTLFQRLAITNNNFARELFYNLGVI